MAAPDLSYELAVKQLRDALRSGIAALDDEGTNAEAIANRLEVSPSTVSRWKGETIIQPQNVKLLADKWPQHFPDVVALRKEVRRLKEIDRRPPTVHVAQSIAHTYRDAAAALEAEASRDGTRRIRHCAFHGEVAHARREDDDLPDELAELVFRFDSAMAACIEDGCHVQTIFTVDTVHRLDGRVRQLAYLDPPALEVRAYPSSTVPLLAPLIIGDTAFLATDHQRWRRAEAALRIEGDTSVLGWLHRYFERLWDQAHYRLRELAGPREEEFHRCRSDLEMSSK